MELTSKRMYRAILEKDASFEGIFFTCVKTTGVFCRPVCTARKPKLENVEFVRNIKDALARGYRPCKRCEPLKKFQETPAYIRTLIEEIQANPSKRITDHMLRERRLEPYTIRRWFLKHHHLTFHAFQRMVRLSTAFQKIHGGETVTATAWDAGFESLSGFGDSFRSVFGFSPKHSVVQQIINIRQLETPLGTMVACATKQGICLLGYGDAKSLEPEVYAVSKRFDAPVVRGDNSHLSLLDKQLTEYFAGQRKQFSAPLVMTGTPFQQVIWKKLQSIPYGEMRTYEQLAHTLLKPASLDAIGEAHVSNNLAILIPCHRVVEPDDNLVPFGGGLWRKKWLLEHEQKHK